MLIVVKFSAEVSEAHPVARVKGPEAADVDNYNKAFIEVY